VAVADPHFRDCRRERITRLAPHSVRSGAIDVPLNAIAITERAA
jgi:hypothetical protein